MMQPGEVYISASIHLRSQGLIIDGSLCLLSFSALAARRGPGSGMALPQSALSGDAHGASERSRAPHLLRAVNPARCLRGARRLAGQAVLPRFCSLGC